MIWFACFAGWVIFGRCDAVIFNAIFLRDWQHRWHHWESDDFS
jgi:hypothetical protein